MSKRGFALPFLILAALGLSRPGAATDQMTNKDGIPLPKSATPVTFQKPEPSPEFGVLDYSTVGIISYSMAPVYPPNDTFTDNGNAYRWPTAGSGFFATAVNLPSGVIIDYIGLKYC